MIGIPLVVGLILTALHQTSSANHAPPSPVLPGTTGERLFWIFISLTAGFCEELVYRGFSIRALQGRNMRTWLAVGLATLAFFFMHGVWAIALPSFLIISIGGLLFSALFLWRRSLVPGVCLHALIDVTNIS
jgi:membrane protease YdiL (CAAX protease family)